MPNSFAFCDPGRIKKQIRFTRSGLELLHPDTAEGCTLFAKQRQLTFISFLFWHQLTRRGFLRTHLVQQVNCLGRCQSPQADVDGRI